MNRNVESYFSTLPDVQLSRSTFDISQDHKFTGNVGQLIPFFVSEVLPGDTFDVTTSKVVRLQTLLAPIMDNLYLDTYFFFVPNRLVWDHWREFMGENTSSAWLQPVEYAVPQINCICRAFKPNPEDPDHALDVGVQEGSLFDYLGVPPNLIDQQAKVGVKVNALPIRAYALIWNEFFRDQNVMDPVNIYTGDAEEEISGQPDTYPEPAYGAAQMWCWPVSRYHDYFSSCLPAPQKGPDVLIPMDSAVPVRTQTNFVPYEQSEFAPLAFRYESGENHHTGIRTVVGHDGSNVNAFARSSVSPIEPSNLWAQLDGMTLSTINNLRLAFQVQKLYEKDARGGTRYIEMLRSHFGVISSDARLQRPEYLGGNRIALNVNQVTNNAQAEQEFLGDLGAFSHTADVHSDFVKSFEEHGFVIGVCCIRYDHTYAQGLERFWSRRTRFDYYWPVFANIGEQPVYRKEIYCGTTLGPTGNDAVFGYQEAWADYRYKPNRVSGQMRPQSEMSLASWNLADDYSDPPTLSYGWMVESRSNVDRVLAVTSDLSHQVLFDIYTQARATRVMPVHSIPGLADHH